MIDFELIIELNYNKIIEMFNRIKIRQIDGKV